MGKTTMACALAVISVSVHAADGPKAARAEARMSKAECEVWNRELSFSRTVEAHDAAAFANHVEPCGFLSAESTLGMPTPRSA